MADALLQLGLSGMALGAAYALAALGFVLVINAVGAVNFAEGDLVMAGGFAAVALASLLPDDAPLPGLLVLPGVLAVMAALGLALSALAYFPLARRPAVSVFISTIAVGIMLQHGAAALFGPAPRAAPSLPGGGTASGGLLSGQQLAVLATAAVLIAATWAVLELTQLGRRLRAAAQDPEMAEAMGINVAAHVAGTFAAAVALAGATGALLSNQFFVTPTDGGAYMLKAYIAVTLGGWGRLDGAVLGALLIGLFETVVAALVSGVVAEALLYLTVLAVLVLRPQGLLAEAVRRRA